MSNQTEQTPAPIDTATEHGARGYVHETGGWIGTPDPITYRGEVVR